MEDSFKEATGLFATQEDLLRTLGDHIKNKGLLYQLCLVNEQFYRVFMPFLYSTIRLGRGTSLRTLEDLSSSRWIRYTRTFYNVLANEVAQEKAGEFLLKMPLLSNLHWPVSAPLGDDLCKRIYKIGGQTRVSTLSIGPSDAISKRRLGLPRRPGTYNARAEYPIHAPRRLFRKRDLVLFSNLTELFFFGIGDDRGTDLSDWISCLVCVLDASPSLKKLGLSIEIQTMHRFRSSGRAFVYGDFLRDLCEEYEDEADSPLHLDTLLLGPGVSPWSATLANQDDGWLEDPQWRPAPATYLEKLTDLSSLEDFHLENDMIQHGHSTLIAFDEAQPSGRSRLAWTTFSPQRTPRLRRLSAATYTRDIHKWLSTDVPSSFIRQLNLSFRHVDHDTQILDLAGNDRVFAPRMMQVDFCTHPPRPSDLVSDFHLIAACSRLEGLALRVAGRVTSPVRNLILRVLTYLPQLQELLVDPEYAIGQPSEQLVDEFADLATRVAVASRSLRYVKVGWMAWHVSRLKGGVRLEELDCGETVEVELFQGVPRFL